jgi:hypothetical protein
MRLAEDDYPTDAQGRPDLACYTEPVDYYVAMYEQHLRAIEGKAGGEDVMLSFRRRVHATSGLRARGAEAIPYALALLRRQTSEAREDGAALLGQLGGGPAAVDGLLAALRAEREIDVQEAMLEALLRLGTAEALAALGAIVADEALDDELCFSAVDKLGQAAGRSFVEEDDPFAASLAWLEQRR